MSITFKKSNGQVISVSDTTVDRTYSASLIGKVSEGYGDAIAQTLFQLMENYASPIPPEQNSFINYDNINNVASTSVRPVTGQLWYNTNTEKLMVYEEGKSWTEVSPDEATITLDPQRDSDLDVGSVEKFWHKTYATHLHVNTNRYAGQAGVADPDNDPALTVDGNIVLSNTSNFSDAKILPAEDSKADLGDLGNPFDVITVEYLRLGNGLYSGLRAHPYDETVIIPSSKDDNTENLDVKLGIDSDPFTDFVVKTAFVSDIRGIGNDRITTVASGTTILPDTHDNLEIGSPVDTLKHTYASNGIIDNLQDNGSFEVGDTAALNLYTNGFKQAPVGSFDDDDTVDVLSEDGVVKKVAYLDLLPVGFVIMWGLSVTEIPYGWAVCDGSTSNGITTPDLSDRFILGVKNTDNIQTTGTTNNIDSIPTTISVVDTTFAGGHDHGGATLAHALTMDEMPRHRHTYKAGSGVENTKSESGTASGARTDQTGKAGGSLGHLHGLDREDDHKHTFDSGSHVHKVNLEDSKIFKLVYIMKVR